MPTLLAGFQTIDAMKQQQELAEQESQRRQEQNPGLPLFAIVPEKYHVHFEWINHSLPVRVLYMLFAAVSLSYYFSAFITQQGALKWLHDDRYPPMECLKEPTLTRVIMIQWLMLAAVLIIGLGLFRRIFMPLYLFLAVMATTGSVALFFAKFKQYSDGKIAGNDLSLNMVGILLVVATTHNLVYFYALRIHLNSSEYSTVVKPTQVLEKQDVNDNFI